MLTDETLSDLLRTSFADATGSLTPAADLTSVVRRRHSAAQRRRAAVRIGVPAVAAASIGAALTASAPRHATTHTAAPSTAVVSTAPAPVTSAPALREVSYRVAFPSKFATVGCVARPNGSSDDTWLLESGNCGGEVTAVIDTDTTLPSTATPITIDGLTGLYGRTDGDTRTVWAHNGTGSYYSLEISAATPDAAVAAFFTPLS